jgi:hypothetical protein
MRTSWSVVLLAVGCFSFVPAGVGCKVPPPAQADEVDQPAYEGGKDDVDQPGVTETPAEKETAGGRSGDTPTTAAPPGMEGLDEDQKAQMKVALRRGTAKAAECVNVVKGAPTGNGDVQVEFDGVKGRATDVTVGSPWAGTDVEGCIKRAFIGEIIMPMEGKRSVTQEIELKPPGAKPPADPKKK